jgi:hypothetical protein
MRSTSAAMNRVQVLLAVLVLATVVGCADPSLADTGVVRVAISGALASPQGTTGDGQITLRAGVGLPVFLISDGGAVIAGSVATATFVQVTDTTPTTGFGPHADVILLRLAGGFLLTASRIDTPGGVVSAFSATQPGGTLSGTWTLTSGAGITGATSDDAVVTFTFETNPGSTVAAIVRFAAIGVFPQTVKPVSGVASLTASRNVPVLDLVATSPGLAGDIVGGRVGTRTAYFVFNIAADPYEYVQLSVIDFGGVYLLSPCAYTSVGGAYDCLAGATDPVARLSGTMDETGGEFVPSLTPNDQRLTLTASLP